MVVCASEGLILACAPCGLGIPDFWYEGKGVGGTGG